MYFAWLILSQQTCSWATAANLTEVRPRRKSSCLSRPSSSLPASIAWSLLLWDLLLLSPVSMLSFLFHSFLENKGKMQHNPNNSPLPAEQNVKAAEIGLPDWQLFHHMTAQNIPLLVSSCCVWKVVRVVIYDNIKDDLFCLGPSCLPPSLLLHLWTLGPNPREGWGLAGSCRHPEATHTHRRTLCWMTRIQVHRSSRDAVWTSYISGGAALIRNIPFSWLAMSRTMRFCSDTTEGLSCQSGERKG